MSAFSFCNSFETEIENVVVSLLFLISLIWIFNHFSVCLKRVFTVWKKQKPYKSQDCEPKWRKCLLKPFNQM